MSDVSIAIMDAAERRMRSGGFNGFSFREIADEGGGEELERPLSFRD